MPDTITSTTTVTLNLNLGPNVSIRALGSAVDDLTRVLDLASALQRHADRRGLATSRALDLRRSIADADGRPIAGDVDVVIYSAQVPDEAWALAMDARSNTDADRTIRNEVVHGARPSGQTSQITVQSMRYENPLELVILVSGTVAVWLLRVLRDWPERQRLNSAGVNEYESRVMFRDRVRRHVLQELESGRLPVTPELMDKLLTDDVTDALGSLGDGPLDVRGLPSGSSNDD